MINKLLKMLVNELPLNFYVEKDGLFVEVNIHEDYWLKLGKGGLWEFVDKKIDKLEDKEVR